MRKSPAPFLSRSVLLCAALALGPGCKSMEPKPTPPSDGTPSPGQDTGAVSTPEAVTPETPTPAQGTSPWQRARVGDRVTYAFSANRSRPGARGGMNVPSAAVAGVVTVEVVAVKAPWVWLGVSFTGDGGAPLPQPRLARSLVLPMRSDETRKLEPVRKGVQSTEQLTAVGRTWDAKRYLHDQRMVDGPQESRLYAIDPGPLYLTNGLLDASTTLSGFGVAGGSQLTLTEVRQGSADASAPLPTLALPMGPGTWFDLHMDSGGTPSVMRTCMGAERGFVLRQQSTEPASGAEACPDFSQAEPVPLEEAVLALAWEALDLQQWPPQPVGTAPAVRGTLELQGHKVPVLQFEKPEDVGGTRGARVVTYAADPWDGSLSGLALEARLQALSDTLFRAPQRGKREPVDGTRLVDWGTWVPGTKP
ncbi:DUF6068 family protein [Pyxidicoccus sp. MSG2]|uniref:DUF6068 family protein n=1 Tax=Pyxidicoccus sp. MSG2 TaxID=2996790 RepID=UPI002271576A|nr:DUF6068 family protein [Pyxidicoccus sp. MSG2]MCY1017317.1 DUF6068 family protein [Pyxidicoccus sp. MSG2]